MKFSTFLLKTTVKAVKAANKPAKQIKKAKPKSDPREFNKQLRTNDIDRYQDEDFTLGYEVRRSNNPNECKTCSQLAGKYPKWFIFSGWCDECKCYIVPILADEGDFNKMQQAILNGKDPNKISSKKAIKDVPAGFKRWVKENIDNSFPDGVPQFVKDNFIDGDIKKGLKHRS